MFLVNSRPGLFTAALNKFRALLLPKLRSDFAEFLNEGSLERLRILSPPTCVSFSTDTIIARKRGFSWKMLQLLEGIRPRTHLRCHIPRIFLRQHLRLEQTVSNRFANLYISVPPCSTLLRWHRIINLLSIVYAFQPRLRLRLTLGGFTFPRKP